MPRISHFFGIEIRMYHNDHGAPHFHVIYQGQKLSIAIDDLRVLRGRMKARAMGLVMEWATLHRDELRANWERVVKHKPLQPIEPLE